MKRVGFDLSKAHHPDGIGTWQRQMARALGRLSGEAIEWRPLWLTSRPTEADVEAVWVALGEQADAFRRAGDGEWTDPSARDRDVEVCDLVISSAWAVPRRFPGRLVYVVHDLTFLTHPSCHTRDNRLHCLEGLMRAVLVADTRFITVSGATARELRRWLPSDLQDPTVIHNGVHSGVHSSVDEFWRPADKLEAGSETFLELGAGDLQSGAYVLSVGSLEPRKNLNRLLDAHQRLDPELRRAQPLVLVGGHGWKNEGLIARLERDPHVRRLGRVSDEDLRRLYQGATLFAYPSLAEGFGLPVVEAMACGAPVLTSNSSSLPEVAGDAAETVDPEDPEAIFSALQDLLTDEPRRRRLASAGPERAARFNWQRAAQELLIEILDS